MSHTDPGAPHERVSRRDFVSGAAVGLVGGAAATWAAWELLARRQSAIGPVSAGGKVLGIPGPFPGRVIEVHHPGSVKNAVRNRDVVRDMIARGMRELVVGSEDAVEAWRYFFHRDDRVGIKVVPVGQPLSISSFEVVQEVVAGLQSAGVPLRNILLFERYKDEFLRVGYHRCIPAGMHWECSSAAYNEAQTDIEGQIPGQPREKHVAGYDPDVFREEAYCYADPKIHHPSDERRFRSHLGLIISRKVDKFISIPVLKDHRSAGVTLALKNLSHGSVNNVARSHISGTEFAMPRESGWGTLNQCNQFIPAMVALPQIRQKAVLQILDGLVATYEGGPGNWNRTFATWERGSLFFATDPVAVDRIGWEIIDEQRASRSLPRIASMGVDAQNGALVPGGPAQESFHIRQPQHVPLAATLGLGTFDRAKIDYRRIPLA
jgi:hypothetical protein